MWLNVLMQTVQNGMYYKVVTRRLLLALLCVATISGCATQPRQVTASAGSEVESILNYEASLSADHPDQVDRILEIDPAIIAAARRKFTDQNRHNRAKHLAQWLVDENAHNMRYDITANLTPIQAYREKRGNCLSFTILLVRLANELGVELKYNDVDLPDIWDQDQQSNLIFYRHINAVYKSINVSQVFDLAMENYDGGFPQRIVSQRTAVAMLHSNLGVDALKEKKFDDALHHLTLSVSIDPNRSFFWINLAVAHKRNGNFDLAEKLLLIAFEMDDKNGLASSNLERLYRSQGKQRLADRFQKRAARSRAQNPYIHFDTAKKHYDNRKIKLAKKSVSRAIKLHDTDPKFFELRSRINQRLQNYKLALADLETAFKLSNSQDERTRYFHKVKRVAKHVEEVKRNRSARAKRFTELPQLRGHPDRF